MDSTKITLHLEPTGTGFPKSLEEVIYFYVNFLCINTVQILITTNSVCVCAFRVASDQKWSSQSKHIFTVLFVGVMLMFMVWLVAVVLPIATSHDDSTEAR